MDDLVQRLRTEWAHSDLTQLAADRIEKLTAGVVEQCNANTKLRVELEQLERENAELRKDAERYRYLFNSADDKVYAAFRKVYDFWDGCDHKAGFDDVMDAAMRGDL